MGPCRFWLRALGAALAFTAAAGGQAPYESLDTGLAPVRAMIERYRADRGNLERFYDTPMSQARRLREGLSTLR